MITNNMSTKFVGAPSLQTSVANAEIIPTGAMLINVTIQTDQNCVMLINGSASGIYVRANQILTIDKCSSLKITTAGITYNWVGKEL